MCIRDRAKSQAVDMAAIEQMFKQLTNKMDETKTEIKETNSKIASTKGQLFSEIEKTNSQLNSKINENNQNLEKKSTVTRMCFTPPYAFGRGP